MAHYISQSKDASIYQIWDSYLKEYRRRGLPVGFLLLRYTVLRYLLLSPYLCLISLLYLDLYVLGDDALIS